MPSESNILEDQLLREIAEVDRRIGELQQERAALSRLLLKTRQQAVTLKDVTRKNSIQRILIEKAITDALAKAGRPVGAADLYRIAAQIDGKLKETTFRSYLHRLKGRGITENSKAQYGFWQLVPKGEKKMQESLPQILELLHGEAQVVVNELSRKTNRKIDVNYPRIDGEGWCLEISTENKNFIYWLIIKTEGLTTSAKILCRSSEVDISPVPHGDETRVLRPWIEWAVGQLINLCVSEK